MIRRLNHKELNMVMIVDDDIRLGVCEEDN